LLKTGDEIVESDSHLNEINTLAWDTYSTAIAIHGTLKKDGELFVTSNKITIGYLRAETSSKS